LARDAFIFRVKRQRNGRREKQGPHGGDQFGNAEDCGEGRKKRKGVRGDEKGIDGRKKHRKETPLRERTIRRRKTRWLKGSFKKRSVGGERKDSWNGTPGRP